jgi:tetratricopeptide (TPR) repeat protein
MAGGAVLVVAGTLSGALVLARGSAASELCTGVERRLEGVWDTPAREAVHAAFGKSKRPFALQAMVALEKTLDRYATEWTVAATDNCTATRIRGEQSDEVLALREECLEQRLGELQALARAIAKADDVTVDRAANAEAALEPVARCANVAALREPARPPAFAQPQIAEIRARLAESKAAIVAGKILDAITAAKKAYEAAKALGLDAQIAPAAHRYGISLFNAGKATDAVKYLEEAAWAGVRGKADLAGALGALDGALVTAAGLHDPSAGRVLLGLGAAIAERAGDKKLDLKRLEVEGAVAGSRGDLLAATTAHEKALALAIEVYGRDATPVAGDEQLLAATLSRRGEFAQALPHYERAFTLMTKLVGTEHPDAAVILTGIGSCHANTGEWKKAHDAFGRALAIRERIYGTTSAVLITTLNNHAELYRDEGDAETGLPLAVRARGIAEKTVGKGHPFYHIASATQAELLTIARREDEARAIFEEIIPLAEKVASPALPSVLASRAHLAVVEQKWEDAASFAQQSITGFEKSAGATTPELRKPLVDLARARIAQDRPADARPHLERALAIAEKGKLPAAVVAQIRELLGKR